MGLIEKTNSWLIAVITKRFECRCYYLLKNKTGNMAKCGRLAVIRAAMAEELKEPGLRQSYVANIAMRLYDDQITGKENGYLNFYLPHPNERPTALNTIDGCNKMAEELLQLIFES